MVAEEPLLGCRDLLVGYSGRTLLPAIDLTIRRGEYWAVIGRNGSGKTSWLKTLLRLLPPVSGRVTFERPGLRLAYLAQRQSFDDGYPLLARDVVAMGLERRGSWVGPRPAHAAAEVAQALALVGAADVAARPFRQLSDGQRQRVLLARVAVGKPDLAVLDEPTSAMDQVAERESCEVLSRLVRETGCALLVVSHYLGLIAEYADRALLLDRDAPAVIVGSPAEVFGDAAFRRRYGVAPSGARHGS